MSAHEEVVGALLAGERRFGLVAARFNENVVDGLVAGARDCLLRHGARPESITLVRVPGAWEIPLALTQMAASGEYDALVALGAVIRGETPHFEHVCNAAAQGAARVSLEHRIPVGFGVLTTDTVEQATARSGGKAGNKGWEAALAALEMADLADRLRERGRGDG